MTDIADLRTAKTGFNDVADIFTELVELESDLASTLHSTTSTSQVNISGGNSLACEAGDKVLIIASGTWSHSISNGAVFFRFRQDSTLAGFENKGTSFRADTGGQDQFFCLSHVLTVSSAGTYEFGLSMRTSSGTVYVIVRQIVLLKLKTS